MAMHPLTTRRRSVKESSGFRTFCLRAGTVILAACYCILQVGGHAYAALSTDQQNAFALGIQYANTEANGSPGACSGGSSIPTTGTGGTASQNEQIAFNYFVTQGLTPAQSAGIIGNMKVESAGTFNPEITQGSLALLTTMTPGVGYGLSQWTDSGRQQGLTDFAQKNGGHIYDLGIQLGYVWYEMTTTEKNVLPALRATTDVATATKVFQDTYERPASLTASLQERTDAANQALTMFGSSAIASSGTVSSSCSPTNVGIGTGKFTTNASITFPGVNIMIARAQQLNDPSSALFRTVCINNPLGATNCSGICDYLASEAWNYRGSGYESALVHWNNMVSMGLAHPGDRNPPVGALLFYDNAGPFGHVATYLGNNEVLSNDILDGKTHRVGGAYIGSADLIESAGWNLHYLGWSDPHFNSSKNS